MKWRAELAEDRFLHRIKHVFQAEGMRRGLRTQAATASQPLHFGGRPDRRSLCSRAKRALECGGLTPLSARDVFLMQTMSNQAGCAFQKFSIFIAERVQFIALGVEHAENVPVVVAHRHNDLRASRVKRR